MRLEWTFVVGALLAGLDGLIQLLVRAMKCRISALLHQNEGVSGPEHLKGHQFQNLGNCFCWAASLKNSNSTIDTHFVDHRLNSASARARRQGPSVLDRPEKRQHIIERIAA
jgi:hypothetical protein